jgi:hypothetical protein
MRNAVEFERWDYLGRKMCRLSDRSGTLLVLYEARRTIACDNA